MRMAANEAKEPIEALAAPIIRELGRTVPADRLRLGVAC